MTEDLNNLNKNQIDIRFVTELTPDYTLKTNRKALRMIVRHLLENALKFTKEGFIELHVSENSEHDMVRFVITDTGIGITPENQDRIFERFFKVDNFKQGFGLGLPISKKIAILLGGTLNLDKTYTEGARFELTLPAEM